MRSSSSTSGRGTSASCRTRSAACLPDLGPIVGYAVTCKTKAAPPADGRAAPDLLADYLRYVAAQPGPKIAVAEDLDDPPGLGAQFGEVTATIHQKLGCVGHITSGCPRDLDEVAGSGLPALRPQPLRQPCLCAAGRVSASRSTSAASTIRSGRPDPRRQARRLHHSPRDRPEAGRGLCRGRDGRSGRCWRSAGPTDFDLEDYIEVRYGLQSRTHE